MSATRDRHDPDVGPKTPVCDDCGYNPVRSPDALTAELADAGYDRPYVEVTFGLDREGRALLCPVCGNLVRRTG